MALRPGGAGHGVAVDEQGKDAVSHAAVADEEHGRDEHETADRARFAFQEESGQVQDHEHHVILDQGQVHRLRDEQHRD